MPVGVVPSVAPLAPNYHCCSAGLFTTRRLRHLGLHITGEMLRWRRWRRTIIAVDHGSRAANWRTTIGWVTRKRTRPAASPAIIIIERDVRGRYSGHVVVEIVGNHDLSLSYLLQQHEPPASALGME